MKWFVKTLAYASLLTLPGHWIAPAYQGLLLGLTGMLLGVPLSAPPNLPVDLSASNLLTVFVALCLASDFAPWSRRLRAVALGIAILVAIECATGVLGLQLASASEPVGPAGAVGAHWLEDMLELSRWLGVPLAWGVLLGREGLAAHQLMPQRPPSGPPAPAKTPAPRGAVARGGRQGSVSSLARARQRRALAANRDRPGVRSRPGRDAPRRAGPEPRTGPPGGT